MSFGSIADDFTCNYIFSCQNIDAKILKLFKPFCPFLVSWGQQGALIFQHIEII